VKRGNEDRRFCAKCRRGKGHIARALRYGAPIEPVNRARVFDRDGWVCQICNRPVDKGLSWPHTESASLDHTVPLSRGGAHSEANTRLAHLGCNIGKGAS
jgi:5-methylcytosine-specific restriction endonuclease McrA